MKNFSSIFQAILGLAVLVLFYLHFSQASNSNAVQILSTDSTGKIVLPAGPGTVYVNGDSLLNNYDYFKKAKKDFEARTKRTENEIVQRRQSLEKELAQYQQTGGGMTTEQRMRAEESLMRKEQDLRAFSENAAEKLQDEQNKFNEALFDKVAEYLKEYSASKNYKIVLNYTKGTGILYANDSLDITSEVLKGLNQEYKKSAK
jgi:outer membrane protein